MTDHAIAALRLYENYHRMPADRGGKDGPCGKVYQAFLEAKAAALAEADAPTKPPSHVETEIAVASAFVRDGGLRSAASVLRGLARWLERHQAARERAVGMPSAKVTSFQEAYPAPWRIGDREVVDRDGCNVQDFDDDPDQVEFWRGVVKAVNAASADVINLQGSGPALIAPREELVDGLDPIYGGPLVPGELSPIGGAEELSKDDLVAAVLGDPAFHSAVGDVAHERRALIADAAVTALLVHVGLTSLVIEVVHEGAGHG